MADQHEAYFTWPSTDPSEVILTGSFDKWAHSIHLHKTSSGFEGKVKVPWGARVPYKFIVDGHWQLDGQPTESDHEGNINNIYTAPPKPAAINGTGEQLQQPTAPASTNILSDLASTVAATDGAPTVTAYVTSGLGTAIENAVGVDPINPQQIPITTTPNAETLPGFTPTSERTAPIVVAPEVPIGTVPVNAESEVESASKDAVLTKEEAPTTHTPAVPAAGADLAIPALSPVPEIPDSKAPAPALPQSKETPATNSNAAASTNGAAVEQTPTTSVPSIPTNVKPSTLSTPTKKQAVPFVSSSGSSPTSSRFTETSTEPRKKRLSFFGKVKRLFESDREKGEDKK